MELDELCTTERHEKGAEIRIKNPVDDSETDVYITIQGIDSKSYRQAAKTQQKDILDDVEGSGEKLLASITIGWRGLTDKGVEVEFSKDRAEQLYSNSPGIARQVDNFAAKRGNFTNG
jgi:hypothetical protein